MSEAPLLLFLCMNEWSMKGLLPCLYSLLRSVWGGIFPKTSHATASACHQSTAIRRCGREELGAVRPHPGCAVAPWSTRLATAFAWWIPGWAWAAPWVVSGLGYLSIGGPFHYSFMQFSITPCRIAPFWYIFIVFMFKSCKNINLQIHVEFG